MTNLLRKWRFLVLLIALIIGLVLEPLILGLRAHGSIFDLLYSLIVITAMGSLTGYHWRRRGVLALGAVTLVATWVGHLFAGSAATLVLAVSECFGIAFLTLAVWAVVRSITHRPFVNLDTVFGAIAGYLLLGLAWSNVFMMLHMFSPGAFAYNKQLAAQVQAGGKRLPVFTYYSFVTLSTLGYGDITPVSHGARTLSWVEAISGQFYIAVLVAGIVSVLVSAHLQDSSTRDMEAESGPRRREKGSVAIHGSEDIEPQMNADKR